MSFAFLPGVVLVGSLALQVNQVQVVVFHSGTGSQGAHPRVLLALGEIQVDTRQVAVVVPHLELLVLPGVVEGAFH